MLLLLIFIAIIFGILFLLVDEMDSSDLLYTFGKLFVVALACTIFITFAFMPQLRIKANGYGDIVCTNGAISRVLVTEEGALIDSIMHVNYSSPRPQYYVLVKNDRNGGIDTIYINHEILYYDEGNIVMEKRYEAVLPAGKITWRLFGTKAYETFIYLPKYLKGEWER